MFALLLLILLFSEVHLKYENILPITVNVTDDGMDMVDLLVVFNSYYMIQNGSMTDRCDDILFRREVDSNETIPYWIESGCGEEKTQLWIRLTDLHLGLTNIFMFYNDILGWKIGPERNRSVFTEGFAFPVMSNSCPSSHAAFDPETIGHLIRISNETLETKEKNPTYRGGYRNHRHTFSVANIYAEEMNGTRFVGVQGDAYDDAISISRWNHGHSVLPEPTYTTPALSDPPSYTLKFCYKKDHQIGTLLKASIIFLSLDPDLELKYPTGKFRKMTEMDGLFPVISDSVSVVGGDEYHRHESDGSTAFIFPPDPVRFHFESLGGGSNVPNYYHSHSIVANFDDGNIEPEYRDIVFYLVLDDMSEGPNEDTVMMTHTPIPMGWEDISEGYLGKYLKASSSGSLGTGGAKRHRHYLVTGSNMTEKILDKIGQNDATISSSSFPWSHSSEEHMHRIELDVETGYADNKPSFVNFVLNKRKKSAFELMTRWDGVIVEDWWCFSINHKSPSVCSSSGYCYDRDYCVCDPNYYGEECQEHIPTQHGVYKTKKTIHIEWNVDVEDVEDRDPRMKSKFDCSIVISSPYLGNDVQCTWKNDKLTRTSFLEIIMDGKDDDEEEDISNIHIIPITQPSFRKIITIEPYDEKGGGSLVWIAAAVLSPLVFICLQICCLCFGVCLIVCGCITVFLISCPIFGVVYGKQRKGLAKLSMIDDIDMLLIEQENSKRFDVASIKVDSKLFEIEYDDIKILERISESGSTAMIYRCVWKGNEVCFKCFKTNDVCASDLKFTEFEREVSILASCSHPSILNFYGACLKEPRVGILCPFCHNGNLKEFMESFPEKFKGAQLESKEKIRILQEIASGMNYIHSKNIIHRDLKSENVLLTNLLEVKIMDFGLSKVVSSFNESKTRKIGTSVYMAPEVTRGEDYDEKCDIFSFGILMFEVVTNNFEPYGKNVDCSLEFKIAQDPNFRPVTPQSVIRDINVNWLILIWKKCWGHSSAQRPTFEEVENLLSRKISLNDDDDDEELEKNNNSKSSQILSVVAELGHSTPTSSPSSSRRNSIDEETIEEELVNLQEINQELKTQVSTSKRSLLSWKEKVFDIQKKLKGFKKMK